MRRMLATRSRPASVFAAGHFLVQGIPALLVKRLTALTERGGLFHVQFV